MSESFVLPRVFRETLLELAWAQPTEEICGLLGCHGGIPVRLLPVENCLHSPHRFEMDSKGLIDAMRSLRAADLELGAIYHSHPYAPAYPSVRDLEENRYPEVIHLIISLEGRTDQGIRAFRLRDQIEELTLLNPPDPGDLE